MPDTYTYLLGQELSISCESKEMAVEIFTHAEKQKIIENYEKSPEHLKQIIAIALLDPETQSIIMQPVYFRGEGRIYSASHVTKDGAIPCHLLIKALQVLLNEPKLEKEVTLLYPDPQTPRAGITEEQVNLIEAFYKKLDPTSQTIIDLLCRNSARKFYYKPVLLPDGYIYEEMSAKALLKIMGKCHPCTDKDITPCHFVAPILNTLLRCAEAALVVTAALNDGPVNNEPELLRRNEEGCRMM